MDQSPLNEIRALVVKGALDDAIQRCGEYLNGDFYHDETLFMLGACLQQKGLNGLSAVITSAAIDSRTTQNKPFPEAMVNLGSAYKAEHDNETAKKIWLQALRHEKAPRERAKIMTNMCSLYINEDQPLGAIEWSEKALAEDPHNPGAKANRGLAYLELGMWRKGWEGYRATYDAGDRHRRHYPGIGEWDGEPGQRVIVYGDQGIGDEIFFANSLADMQKICKSVILDCHPRLTKLFKRSYPEITVHGTRKDLSQLDWYTPGMADAAICLSDLPRFFRNEASDWRGEAYLKAADAQKISGTDTVLRAAARNSKNSPLRIGLSWTGGSKKTRTELRSFPVETLLPALKALAGRAILLAAIHAQRGT